MIASRGSGGSNNYTANFQITDHLGSVRVVFTNRNNVIARNDYYAFGKNHANSSLQAGSDTSNRFLFNGKELQTTGDLGFLDYSWRMYDSEVGRWFGMDQMTEVYRSLSPYSYTGNNPVSRIELDGRIWVDANGNVIYDSNGFTSYAEPWHRRLAIALWGTPMGGWGFKELINANYNIEIVLVYGDNAGDIRRMGRTGDVYYNPDTMEFTSAQFYLYADNIESGKGKYGITFWDMAAGTATHEVVHVTSPENLLLQIEYLVAVAIYGKDSKEAKELKKKVEAIPTQIGMVAIYESQFHKHVVVSMGDGEPIVNSYSKPGGAAKWMKGRLGLTAEEYFDIIVNTW